MRMMKGDEEPEMTLGTILFVVALIFVFGIVLVRFTEYSAVIKNDAVQIEMVNMAHIAKSCFEAKSGMIPVNDISLAGKDGCGIGVHVCIRDIETGDEWLECDKVDDPVHEIHSPLLTSGGQVHMGELSVQD